MTNRDMALREAFRVLKPGGRFCCLEFSTVQNATFSKLYDLWSFNALPQLGRMVARDEAAYRYLARSIRTFPAQHDLARMMSEAGLPKFAFGICQMASRPFTPVGNLTDGRNSSYLAAPADGLHSG